MAVAVADEILCRGGEAFSEGEGEGCDEEEPGNCDFERFGAGGAEKDCAEACTKQTDH